MLAIGIIKEGKIPHDNRVALTPDQCKWLINHYPELKIFIQPSELRCYNDADYGKAGAILSEDLSACDWLFGIKEVPVDMLIPNKRYMFFSHTIKKQPYNKALIRAMANQNITLVDYECLVHENGTRVIGFGFFAGVVGAHNGLLAYGNKTGSFNMKRAYQLHDYAHLLHSYNDIQIPPIKIVVTGGGRVATGIIEVMQHLNIKEVTPEQYLTQTFDHPVYVHLKGEKLYTHKESKPYNRSEFHEHPQRYKCLFPEYISQTDILMNGIFWNQNIPPLFSLDDMKKDSFKIETIADVTDDAFGSVPCNLGDATIEEPVYSVDKLTNTKTTLHAPGSVDVMAVGNLPNELPRDASRLFGEQLIKFVFPEIINQDLQDSHHVKSFKLPKATILLNGSLTEEYKYLHDYVFS